MLYGTGSTLEQCYHMFVGVFMVQGQHWNSDIMVFVGVCVMWYRVNTGTVLLLWCL